MKKYLFLPALLFAFALQAQENQSGTVVYEQTVKLEIKLEGDAAQFADMLPKERKSNKVLYFNPEVSSFQNGESADNDAMNMSSGGGNMTIQMKEPENKVFTNLKKNTQLEQREFMTRMFLIEGKSPVNWKMTGNQKMILDYPCQEAVTEIDSLPVNVWFTPAIPVSAGPGNYSGLPGIVLEVNSNNGKRMLLATSVELGPVDNNLLEIPKKGKKVSREEFTQIVDEKMKEMGGQKGEGGNVMMIRIER